MPQLNPLDWAPQLIWLVLTFGVLYLLMVWVALPRIGGVIERRAAHISGDLSAADKFRRETEEAIAAYEQALAEAKQKAHAIIEEGRAKLKAESDAERAKLEKELAAKKRGSRSAHRRGQGLGHERGERRRRRRRRRHRAPADRHGARQRRHREGGRGGAEGVKAMEVLIDTGILGRRLLLPVPRRRALSRRAQEGRRRTRRPRRGHRQGDRRGEASARGGGEGARRLSRESRAMRPRRRKPSWRSPPRRPSCLPRRPPAP